MIWRALLLEKPALSIGPQWLSSVIDHEMVHYKQGFWGRIDDHALTNKYETQAYQHQFSRAEVFSLSYVKRTAV